MKNAIDRVMKRRRARGATDQDIEKYKQHLLGVWRNNEKMKERIKNA